MEMTARYYREQADRCRQLAKRVLDWSTRKTLLDVAIEYEKLAARAERKGK